MKLIRHIAAFSLLAVAGVAQAQVAVTQPNYTLPSGQPKGVPAQNQIGKDGSVVGPGTSIAASQAAVTTAATLVCPARVGRQQAILTETTAVDFYYGPAGVTTGTGAYVKGAAGASVSLATSAAIYAVGTGAVAITCAEIY